MAKASIFDFSDFRGGYFTDVPSDLMKDNELLTAENCYWRNGLKKRLGKASYVSLTGSNIRGGIRSKLGGTWYTVLAVQESAAGVVEFKLGTDTAFATIQRYDADTATYTSHSFTGGYDVAFAVLDERVVAVNGESKPAVIWPSATATYNFHVDTLERYDKRTMDYDDWYAGQYYPSFTSTGNYIDDTTDAQDAGTGDFVIASTSFAVGWWVGCTSAFNKVTLYGVAATNTTVLATYSYFGKASAGASTETWVNFTPLSTPTYTVAGNKFVEFNIPMDSNTNEVLMKPCTSITAAPDYYAVKCEISTSCTFGIYLDSIQVDHTQYLTQILLNDKPDTIATHKSHLFMGMGNWAVHSPYGTVKGWRQDNLFQLTDGGYIQQMVPHIDYLALIMDNAIYGIYGNSWDNFASRLINGSRGAVSKRGAALVNEEIYFVARDGIYGWNGSRLLKLSKHIKSDIDTYTLTNAAAANVNGEYWVSFPTNSYTLVFDPDTLRLDDQGDGRVSFYRFTPYKVHQFLPYTGADDNGNLMAIVNATSQVRLDKLEVNSFDKIGSSSTISMIVRTKDCEFGDSNQNKVFRRLKAVLGQASATGGIAYTLKHYATRADSEVTSSVAINVTVGTGYQTVQYGIPPGIDGFTYGVYIAHDTQYDAKFAGYSVEVEKRSY